MTTAIPKITTGHLFLRTLPSSRNRTITGASFLCQKRDRSLSAIAIPKTTGNMLLKTFPSWRNRFASSSRQKITRFSTLASEIPTMGHFAPDPDYDLLPKTTKMNLFTSVNSAMRTSLSNDPTTIVFGEDVAFGGVFRCSQNLQSEFGPSRVFNTPLSENGIAGFAVGYAAMGGTAIAEIQFADYIFPALDQIINEMAKFRYRSGNQWNCGRVVVRAPCGAVGHGGHYHSQSPEAYLAHTPGLCVVMPRGPRSAKGLFLESVKSPDPVIFLEPKVLYRSAVEEVPDEDYCIPLGKAEIMREGEDVTVLGWGGHLRVLEKACDMAKDQHGINCELIDLRTILPWDVTTIANSVNKTGKLIVSHEAPITCGFGAEVVATIQHSCFDRLEAPIQRVCGYDTPFPLVFEKYYIPDKYKNIEAIVNVMEYAQ